MTRRSATTAITMTALALLLCAMAWVGYEQVSEPLPSLGDDPAEQCSEAEISRQRFIKREDVTVSVYNAHAPQGFAGLTLRRLEDRGFRPGALGNAPPEARPRVATVFTTEEDDPAARLVARNLGKGVDIEVTTDPMGPGIDVYVGPKLGYLRQDAPARLKLDEPIETCVQVDD